MPVNKHIIIDKTLDKLHDQRKTYWTQDPASYTCPIFVAWRMMYKNEKLIQKDQAVVDL